MLTKHLYCFGHISHLMKLIIALTQYTYQIPILLSLLDGEKTLSNLCDIIGVNNTTLIRSIDALKRFTLIHEEKGDYNRRIFKLSKHGKKIALKCNELDTLLQKEMNMHDKEITIDYEHEGFYRP